MADSLALPADALLLGRALAGRPGLSLVRSADGLATYLGCDPVDRREEPDPEPSLPIAPRAGGEIPRWIGYLPYEAQRWVERSPEPDLRPPSTASRPCWKRYAALVKITNQVEVVGDDSQAIYELRERLESGLRQPASPGEAGLLLTRAEPGALHAARIREALALIARGEIYQVNLARRFELGVRGRILELLFALCPGGLTRNAVALDWEPVGVAAASPELFLELTGNGELRTTPIKGTRPRSNDVAQDELVARALDADPKERAELAMVIDIERNDLGRIARPGSVRLSEPPHVERLATVHHRMATVAASLRPGIGRREVLEAMLPSGSVTGAPKVRAMEVIRALEPVRRGLYTGAVGFVRSDGGLELGMAIRTLTVEDGRGTYFSGGGIVADSDPEREVEETLWKARRLIELSGVGIENWA